MRRGQGYFVAGEIKIDENTKHTIHQVLLMPKKTKRTISMFIDEKPKKKKKKLDRKLKKSGDRLGW